MTTKVEYSPSEKTFLKLLPKSGKKVTSAELIAKRKKLAKWEVSHPQVSVTLTMRNLIDKVAKNREGFRVMRSGQRGPHPVEFWIEESRQKQQALSRRPDPKKVKA